MCSIFIIASLCHDEYVAQCSCRVYNEHIFTSCLTALSFFKDLLGYQFMQVKLIEGCMYGFILHVFTGR